MASSSGGLLRGWTCPRCGTAAPPGERICLRCGYASGPATSVGSSSRDVEYDLVRLVVAALASFIFAFAGWHLFNIRSVGSLTGDGSIFEVFFQGVAFMAWGLAALSVAVGLRRG